MKNSLIIPVTYSLAHVIPNPSEEPKRIFSTMIMLLSMKRTCDQGLRHNPFLLFFLDVLFISNIVFLFKVEEERATHTQSSYDVGLETERAALKETSLHSQDAPLEEKHKQVPVQSNLHMFSSITCLNLGCDPHIGLRA